MSHNDFIIKLENVKKVYGKSPNEVLVFSNLNLNVKKGSFFGIIGPSGSGKSTILNLIGGLDTPTEGKVIVKGLEISSKSSEERALFRKENISYVFQFHHLIPELNIEENIALPLLIKNFKKKFALERAREFLKELNMENLRKRYPKELSGGEQQRVCIGRACITEPEIMLLDEPTGSLDAKNSQVVIDIFKNLYLKKKITFVIVTHNEILKSLCNEIFSLGA